MAASGMWQHAIMCRRRLIATSTSITNTTRAIRSNSRRCAFSSSNDGKPNSIFLSPSEAGQAAYDIRQLESSEKEEDTLCNMETLLSHAGLSHAAGNGSSNNWNAPLCPPIELATTWERPPNGEYGADSYIYSRAKNPTRANLEETLAQLEGGGMAAAFSSGMAASAALILAHEAPLTVLLPHDVYHGVPTALHTVLEKHNVQHKSVRMTKPSTGSNDGNDGDEYLDILQESIIQVLEQEQRNVVLWIETPSNPLCDVADISAICRRIEQIRNSSLTKQTITTVVDSTWAPPLITQPLLLGADAVVHSGTKYLGGHSDVLLGLVVCSKSSMETLGTQVRQVQIALGAVASPLDSWLTLRGMRTLHVRLERQCRNALSLAEFLYNHPLVSAVHYPGLPSHSHHGVASRQMKNDMYGGMLSFEMENESMAMAVAGALQIIRRATSLGGTETLIEHRASIEPVGRVTSPPGLLRMSVGLEHVHDLKDDLDQALRIAHQVVPAQPKST
uniref:cystathionine gamma-lyase n=1 Tax=Attheya septentrionalis TaxID=420275 RepID=A0A7S2UMD0_9STRA